MRRWSQISIRVFSVAFGFSAGCAALDGATSEPEDIGPGATGERVTHIQEYLSRYGYLPNEELGKDPRWHPVVDKAPAPGVFDEATTDALREFQARSGLPDTGIYDEATRALMARRRCGVPEGFDGGRIESKFALNGEWKYIITWRVQNTNDVTIEEAREAARRAFATWAADSLLRFSEVTGSADIEITFGTIDGPRGTAAVTNSSHDIKFDIAENWGVGAVPASGFDLENVLLHEIGHSLGLNHSSVDDSVMWPATPEGTASHVLSVDDRVAISALYDAWAPAGRSARHIAVAQTTSGPTAAWMVGDGAAPGGYKIWKWNDGPQWIAADGGAVRIAVEPSGIPWVVNSFNEIFRRTSDSPTTGTWEWVRGSAQDIAVGADGSVWPLARNAFTADMPFTKGTA